MAKVPARRGSGKLSDSAKKHPWEYWFEHQRWSAKRVAQQLEPKYLIPSITGPQQYRVALPTEGVTDRERKPICRIVKGRRTEEVIPGFPAALNRPCATMDEVDKLRLERLAWAEEHCAKIASKRSGDRADELKLVHREKVIETTYGLLGLDVSLVLRFGSQNGLDAKPWAEKATLYGASLLREQGVVTHGAFFHPGNPFRDSTSGGGGAKEWEEFGFGNHVQFDTIRGLGGVYLTEHTDFSHLGPADIAKLHMRRLGVDVHAYSRASEARGLEWEYGSSTPKDWERLKLEPETVRRIKRVQKRIAAGKSTLAEEVAAGVAAWDAQFARPKTGKDGKDYVSCKDAAARVDLHLASKSKTQKPVDWMLSTKVTAHLLEELGKDPAWAPYIARAQRCAKDIETQRYQGGFKQSLSELLHAWEIAERDRVRDEELSKKDAELKAAASKVADADLEIATLDAALAAKPETVVERVEVPVEVERIVERVVEVPVVDSKALELATKNARRMETLVARESMMSVIEATGAPSDKARAQELGFSQRDDGVWILSGKLMLAPVDSGAEHKAAYDARVQALNFRRTQWAANPVVINPAVQLALLQQREDFATAVMRGAAVPERGAELGFALQPVDAGDGKMVERWVFDEKNLPQKWATPELENRAKRLLHICDQIAEPGFVPFHPLEEAEVERRVGEEMDLLADREHKVREREARQAQVLETLAITNRENLSNIFVLFDYRVTHPQDQTPEFVQKYINYTSDKVWGYELKPEWAALVESLETATISNQRVQRDTARAVAYHRSNINVTDLVPVATALGKLIRGAGEAALTADERKYFSGIDLEPQYELAAKVMAERGDASFYKEFVNFKTWKQLSDGRRAALLFGDDVEPAPNVVNFPQ